jgi:hypothetical protein
VKPQAKRNIQLQRTEFVPVRITATICDGEAERRRTYSYSWCRHERIIPSKLNGKRQKIICRRAINLR